MADEDLEFVDTFSIIHLADDIEAKWKLRNLFKDSWTTGIFNFDSK